MQKITTFLTFESRGKEAVDLYVSVFKNSKINTIMVMPGSDQLLHASFTLDGQDFMAMDGGSHFNFADGTSLFVKAGRVMQAMLQMGKIDVAGLEQAAEG